MKYDYTISLDNNLAGIHPENPTAIQFLDENVETEGWQFLGNTLWIDIRYTRDIYNLLKTNGFNIHVYV